MNGYILCGLALFAALPAAAGVSKEDLPAGTVWYLHADLDAMRNTDSGRELYGWLEGEVVVEIKEELGIDLNKEADRVTAYSTEAHGTVVIVEGAVSRSARDKLLEIAGHEHPLEVLEYGGRSYYHVGDEEAAVHGNGVDDLDASAYFTFDIPERLIVASREAQLKALMDSGGRIPGGGRHDGALFVLSADKDFVQAGLRTDEFADDEQDWDSNILRNTEQAALLVADRGGLIVVEAQLVSTDPGMAESIGSIVSGLISLQAFNSGLESDVARALQSTKVDVLENVLSISTVLEPKLIRSLLDD